MVARPVRLNCRAVPRALSPNVLRPHYQYPTHPARFNSSDAVSTVKKEVVGAATGAATATAATSAVKGASPKRRFRRFMWTTAAVLGMGCGYVYMTDTRASAHRYLVPPLMRWMYPDAEDAHHVGVDMLKLLYRFRLHPRERGNPDGDGKLVTEVCACRIRTHSNLVA